MLSLLYQGAILVFAHKNKTLELRSLSFHQSFIWFMVMSPSNVLLVIASCVTHFATFPFSGLSLGHE